MHSPESISIVIVDDHPMWREGVVATLEANPALRVVGEGGNAQDALRLAQEHLPDIMLLDLNLPGGGLEALRAVCKSCPVTRVVMLTFSEAEDDVLGALRSGARGYALKGISGAELRTIVLAVQAGEVYVAPSLAALMLHEMVNRDQAEPKDPLEDLTPRERQILELVANGKSNKEVAANFGLSEKTVKHHMTNILEKLHVRNRVEAALLAHDRKR